MWLFIFLSLVGSGVAQGQAVTTPWSPGLLGMCGCYTALHEEAESLGWKAVGGGHPASIICTSGDIQQSKSFALKKQKTVAKFQLLLAS